ncbi:amino acid permease [Rhizoctonia solani]|uniref:Amino acid permease n=1 Tax=Rhizoctonia solani TaxID=456999 RepID=A0A8H8SWS7_9AGAM|nr:amino acid permease [Rhizoctonia solani]QRW21326.1 amino acid permease [Rhizoctonia solani]
MQPLTESVVDNSAFCDGEEEAGQALTALAPIEETSPLGYNFGFANATLMNISAMASKDLQAIMNGVAAFFQMGCLLLVSATGLACLLGWTTVPNSGSLRRPFEGSRYEANPFATSVVKVLYSFLGWNSVIGLMAEVKGRRPVRTIRRAGITSVLIATFLFIATILSFSIILTKEEMKNADEVLGVIFLRKVYGDTVATKLFPILVGINAFGGIVAGTLQYGRMLREAGRQGTIPFAAFWSRVGRFKTPYGPALLKWAMAILLIVLAPAQDAVVFLIDLTSYPALVFSLLIGCGVWILRRRRERLGLPEHAYKAPNIAVVVYVVQSIALIIMPWIPPKGGSKGGDVGFFYAAYCIFAIIILLLSGFYYWVRLCALPQWFGYELVEETVPLPGGVKITALKKVYKYMDDQQEPLLGGRTET